MNKMSVSLAAILLCGCSTTGMFNTYLDFSDLKSGGKSQTACKSVLSTASMSSEFKGSFEYACDVRDRYRKAMANRSTLRRTSTLPVLGLGAIGVGLGLSSYDSTTTILATSLTGATIAGGSRLYDTRSDERAYVLGAEAITCAMQAVAPLAMPADATEMNLFDQYLTSSSGAYVETSLLELKTAILEAEGAANRDGVSAEDKAIVANQIKSARDLVTLTETTIRQARALRSQRVQAPLMLTGAVDRIIGNVDTAIQTNALSIDSTVAVISSLATSYKSFTSVPTDLPQTPSQPTTGGDTPGDDGLEAVANAVRALSENPPSAIIESRVEALRAASQVLENAWSEVDEAQQAFDDSNEKYEIAVERKALMEVSESPENGVRTMTTDTPVDAEISRLEREVESKEQRLEDSRSRVRDAQADYRDAFSNLTNAHKDDENLSRTYAQALERLVESLTREPKPQEEIDRRSSDLDKAISKVDGQRRLLADVVNSVVSLKPAETLKACGVDPDSVVGSLSVEPARLEFTKSQSSSQFVVINGGQPPFSTSLASGDSAVTLDKPDPFMASFSVSYDGEAEGRSDILIVDGANTRIILPVSLTKPVEAKPQQPVTPLDQDRALRLAGASPEEKAAISARNLADAGRTKDNIEELQMALCLAEVEGGGLDGVWGEITQTQYELNRAAYGIPDDDDGIITAQKAQQIFEILNGFERGADNVSCEGGKVTLPTQWP